MLRFFRNIRQKLIEQENIRKYIWYALGEILLVMIGILLALQVNNWNEDRKDRYKELKVLQQLKEDYTSNLNQLDEKINIRNQTIASSKWLLSYIDGNSSLPKDSILVHLGRSSYAATFDPITTDNVINSGELSLLRNDKLKYLLTSWTSEVVQVTEEEQDWNNFKDDIRTPFLTKHNAIRDLIANSWSNDEILITFIDKDEAPVKIDMSPSKRNIDYEAIIMIAEFESILAFGISRNAVANVQSITLRKRIIELLDLIDQEIKKIK
ncbi:MAG: DUF6090 family protein [Balneola sp.]|jgi:hypothetical protein